MLEEYLGSLAEQPASYDGVTTDELRALVEPLPEEGADAEGLFRRVIGECVPRSFNAAGPGYLAYVPGGGLPSAAVADLIGKATNRYVGVFTAAPLLARIEMTAVRWFCDLAGYPERARGILTSGGSLANLIALVCGRHRELGPRFGDGVVYVSDQAHHSLIKAASFVGFAPEQVRSLGTAEDHRLDVHRLREAIAEDRARGLRPAIVVASAGTTNTGVVDDLAAVADVARDESLWLHVDAAYGGAFLLTERGRATLAGIDRADSITVDPHKGLFLPYGTGCLLVREGEDLRRPHASESDYMPPKRDDELSQDFCEYSPELSRDFRGLRMWLPLKLHGAAAFRAALDEKLDLAAWASEGACAHPRAPRARAAGLDARRVPVRARRGRDRGAGPAERRAPRARQRAREGVALGLVGARSLHAAHLRAELPHAQGARGDGGSSSTGGRSPRSRGEARARQSPDERRSRSASVARETGSTARSLGRPADSFDSIRAGRSSTSTTSPSTTSIVRVRPGKSENVQSGAIRPSTSRKPRRVRRSFGPGRSRSPRRGSRCFSGQCSR